MREGETRPVMSSNSSLSADLVKIAYLIADEDGIAQRVWLNHLRGEYGRCPGCRKLAERWPGVPLPTDWPCIIFKVATRACEIVERGPTAGSGIEPSG